MQPPRFTVEIPVSEARPGDTVQFRSDLGGYRIGKVTIPTKKRKGYLIIRCAGRARAETVKIQDVSHAFRDVMTDDDDED